MQMVTPVDNQVKNWYNTFSTNQQQTGINLRHYTIINQLIKFGLRRDSNVLEIGCGIGTITGLIHSFTVNGQLTGVDISDVNIDIAKQRIGESKRLNLLAIDVIDFSCSDKFDFIVLPDVLEHIPIEQHFKLFEKLSSFMHERSLLVIHIPHPKSLNYKRIHHPKLLQVIDQSLNADDLIATAYKKGLILKSYRAYGLYNTVDDNIFLSFRKTYELESLKPKTVLKIRIEKLVLRLKYLRYCLLGS